MNRWMLAAAAAVLFAPHLAWSQAHQPYAAMDARPIKALSAQQIADLRAGRGMGLALAAELNGYPGPLHVLELQEQLGLSPAQRDSMTALFDAMKAEAVVLGEKLIATESALDRQFAGKTITEESLMDGVQAVAAAQGTLRAAHLKYHLATVKVLTPEQVTRYAGLRGYAGGPSPSHHGGGRN